MGLDRWAGRVGKDPTTTHSRAYNYMPEVFRYCKANMHTSKTIRLCHILFLSFSVEAFLNILIGIQAVVALAHAALWARKHCT